jgi:hypothetical protein
MTWSHGLDARIIVRVGSWFWFWENSCRSANLESSSNETCARIILDGALLS